LTSTYLDLVDTALPGFVENLYVVGSTALGAWQPSHSDVDTMIVVSEPITADHLSALRVVHEALPASPKYDVSTSTGRHSRLRWPIVEWFPSS
jgi:hypothetical protein